MASDESHEEFVRLSLSDSTYAKVIFHQVKDSYESSQDLKCVYTHLSSTGTKEGDIVGLFKVGWSSVKDYVVAAPCEIDQITEQPGSPVEKNVIFTAESLPKEDGEYYQFCYITAEGELRGGSTPFSFKTSALGDELFSVEDIENDLLLIQTRTTVLEESLQNAIKEKTSIQIERQLLEKNLKKQMEVVSSLETTLKTKEDVIAQLNAKISGTEAEFLNKETLLKEEMVQNEHFIKGLRIALATLGKEKDELIAKLAAEETSSKAITENCAALQKNVDAFKKSEASLLEEIKRQQNMMIKLKENIAAFEKCSMEKSNQCKILEKQIEAEQIQHKNITERLIDTENMLAAVMTSKSLASEELQKHTEKEAELEKSRALLVEKNHVMELKIQELENEKIDILKKLDDVVAESTRMKEETKLMSQQQMKLEEGCVKMQNENKELHQRLILGGEEYKRKYIEWFKLQKKITKLQQKLVQSHSLSATNCNDVTSQCSADTDDNVEVSMASSQKHCSKYNSGAEMSCKNNENCPIGIPQCTHDSGNAPCESEPKYYNDYGSCTEITSSSSCKTDSIPSSPIHNVAQREKIHAEMENQLQKFQSSKNPQSTPGSSHNIKEASVSVSLANVVSTPYPYPPYYPYPYPDSVSNPSCMTTSMTNLALENFKNPYVEVSQNVYGTYLQPETSFEHSDTIYEDSFYVVPPMPPVARAPNVEYGGSPKVEYLWPTHLRARQQQTPGSSPSAPDNVAVFGTDRNTTHVSSSAGKFIKCPMCTERFPEGTDINDHLDGHFYFTCPVCNQQFDKEKDGMEVIHKHVCDHLD